MTCDDSKLLEKKPALRHYEREIAFGSGHLEQTLQGLQSKHGGLAAFANGAEYYGFHPSKEGWVFREWAPGAKRVYLLGDFNGWQRHASPLTRLANGNWELRLEGRHALAHESNVRLLVETESECLERIPVYCRRVNLQYGGGLAGQVWQPEKPYRWKHPRPAHAPRPLLVYDCHIGVCREEPGIASYDEFRRHMLPRVKRLGYNTLLLIGLQEHCDYASCYRVANFYAPSSRFGTPEDLKRLVDEAHGLGLSVMMELVHSGADDVEFEGLSRFDSTQCQYFHEGKRGIDTHSGCRMFHYGKPEVLRFLLSNARYWLEEYQLDGLCYENVTGMLYKNHGRNERFSGPKQYFNGNTDLEALTYLRLAAMLCRQVLPGCLLIAEERSGMPGLCMPVEQGGLGFDYCFADRVPGYWKGFARQAMEGSFQMSGMWGEVCAKAAKGELGVCECRKQTLRGKNSLMLCLLETARALKQDAAAAAQPIHKMIRLLTCAAGDGGYTNVAGTEYGNPEKLVLPCRENQVDFSRSNLHCSLALEPESMHQYLERFEQAMLLLAKVCHRKAQPLNLEYIDETDKVLVFCRGKHLFMFNFHPQNAFSYQMPPAGHGMWQPVMYTCWKRFGGKMEDDFSTSWIDEEFCQKIYLYARSAAVYERRSEDLPAAEYSWEMPALMPKEQLFAQMHAPDLARGRGE